MMNKLSLVIRFIIFCFLILTFNLNVFSMAAQPANFLENGIDARTAGMGNTWTTLYNGVYNVYNNPALLYQVENHNITGTYTLKYLDIKNSFIGYGHSLSKKTGIAFGWYRTGTSIEETTESEEILGEKNFIADCIFAGIGYRTKIPGPIGFTLKYIDENFSPFKLSGVGLDFGIVPITSKNFNIGLTIKNIFGTKLKGSSYWDKEKIEETVPTKLRIGIVYFSTTELELPKENIKFDSRFLVDYEDGLF